MDTCKKTKVILLCMLFATITGCSNSENHMQTKVPNNSQSTKIENTQVDSSEDVLNEIVEEAEKEMYEQIVSGYNKMPITKIDDLLTTSASNQNYYFYFGRTTCLYCRKFVIENEESIKDIDNFYYVDTEGFSEEESKLLEDYDIKTVPAILHATTSTDIKLMDIEKFKSEVAK